MEGVVERRRTKGKGRSKDVQGEVHTDGANFSASLFDATIAGSDIDGGHLARLGQLPGDGMLSGTGPNDQRLLGHFAGLTC